MPDSFADWVGRAVVRHDVLTPRVAQQFHATLAPHVFTGAEVPPGLHWCLAVPTPTADELGPDGAERKGLFLPPVPLPRRMWAGGQVESLAPLRVGMDVRRDSTITNVAWREGSAGPLCIVSVTHEISGDGTLAVRERHDILFRGGGAAPAPPAATTRPPAELTWQVEVTPLLLFRFSAITFNGHRIHYDAPYATGEEGYDGLLVHGPLQAALALNLVATLRGTVPRLFRYRCVAPLTAGQRFDVCGFRADAGARAQIFTAAGTPTLEADAT